MLSPPLNELVKQLGGYNCEQVLQQCVFLDEYFINLGNCIEHAQEVESEMDVFEVIILVYSPELQQN